MIEALNNAETTIKKQNENLDKLYTKNSSINSSTTNTTNTNTNTTSSTPTSSSFLNTERSTIITGTNSTATKELTKNNLFVSA